MSDHWTCNASENRIGPDPDNIFFFTKVEIWDTLMGRAINPARIIVYEANMAKRSELLICRDISPSKLVGKIKSQKYCL